jgi:hypothetical protein
VAQSLTLAADAVHHVAVVVHVHEEVTARATLTVPSGT